LAAAYGIAVSLTMLITTTVFAFATRLIWRWPLWLTLAVCVPFFLMELSFVLANGLKVMQGGWFPIAIGAALCLAMTTWRSGRRILRDRLAGAYLPLDFFLQDLADNPPVRVPGTAVFLSGNPTGTPLALLHNLKHNKVLHEQVIVLTVGTTGIPFVPENERVMVEHLRPDVHRVTGRYGFMEQPDVPKLLEMAAQHGLPLDLHRTTFFLSRETIRPGSSREMSLWRRRLFATLSRNAQSATAFFKLPANRVVELGMQVEL
jgi:KUP system potassium uptake protein